MVAMAGLVAGGTAVGLANLAAALAYFAYGPRPWLLACQEHCTPRGCLYFLVAGKQRLTRGRPRFHVACHRAAGSGKRLGLAPHLATVYALP